MPVVTATCPRRLNHPVIHDANGARFGGESIAAQKYGPPLVGCALHTSGSNGPADCRSSTSAKKMKNLPDHFNALEKRFTHYNLPAIANPTIIVKNAGYREISYRSLPGRLSVTRGERFKATTTVHVGELRSAAEKNACSASIFRRGKEIRRTKSESASRDVHRTY